MREMNVKIEKKNLFCPHVISAGCHYQGNFFNFKLFNFLFTIYLTADIFLQSYVVDTGVPPTT